MSKGSGRRPPAVPEAEIARRWDETFGKIKDAGGEGPFSVERHGNKVYILPVNRCPICNGLHTAEQHDRFTRDAPFDSVIKSDTPENEK